MGKQLLWLTVRSRRVRGMPTSIGNFHSKRSRSPSSCR